MGIFTRTDSSRHVQSIAAIASAHSAAARFNAVFNAVSAPVMLADEQYMIVGVNPAAMRMLQAAEADLSRELPQFSLNHLVGSSIDVFHKHPSHQRKVLDTLRAPHEGRIKVGPRTFQLIASPLADEKGVRIGTVVEWQDLSEQLAREHAECERLDREHAEAADNARVKAALDAVTSNVMMADADNIIIYANDAVLDMLRNAESDLRRDLPNFDVSSVVGNSVDQFHRNPAHQRALLSTLSSTFRTRINVGGRNFALIATPVYGQDRKRLGTVVEWQDNTEEFRQFEQLVNSALESAGKGRLHERLDAANLTGYMANFANGFNNLMGIFEAAIDDARRVATALAAGDLSQKVEAAYEGRFADLGDSINATVDRLSEVVEEIHRSAASVRTGAEEISVGNNSLSQRTERQAASLEETSAAMEQITATVQQNASNAKDASSQARAARETAEEGGKVVNEAISAMQAISESSRRINDIIGVIDEIAFQTNLLALNAAVEAARAGDQGRGFAVVADEVRSLAGRSAKAAKEIKTLIQDSNGRVDEGSRLVNRSGETLGGIVAAVKRVNDIVAEISSASGEQSSSLEEINRAVVDMDDVTQQNAALVEEAAAASESLGEQAQRLQSLIAFFRSAGTAARESVRPVAARIAPKPAAPKVASTRGKVPAARPRPAAAPVRQKSREDEGKDWSEF